MKRPNIYHLLIVSAIVIVLKLWFQETETSETGFMLAPVASLLEVALGEEALFVNGEGYYFAGLNIIINKSCSGFNFLCICFFLLCFIVSGYPFKNRRGFYLFMPVMLLLSYVITLLVNFSRILLAVLINIQAGRLGIALPGWFHLAEGTFVYLFFLILVYLFTHILFSKQHIHA